MRQMLYLSHTGSVRRIEMVLSSVTATLLRLTWTVFLVSDAKVNVVIYRGKYS